MRRRNTNGGSRTTHCGHMCDFVRARCDANAGPEKPSAPARSARANRDQPTNDDSERNAMLAESRHQHSGAVACRLRGCSVVGRLNLHWLYLCSAALGSSSRDVWDSLCGPARLPILAENDPVASAMFRDHRHWCAVGIQNSGIDLRLPSFLLTESLQSSRRRAAMA